MRQIKYVGHARYVLSIKDHVKENNAYLLLL